MAYLIFLIFIDCSWRVMFDEPLFELREDYGIIVTIFLAEWQSVEIVIFSSRIGTKRFIT